METITSSYTSFEFYFEESIMIAVTGANGQLGQLVIKHLLNMVKASEILALVRNPEHAPELKQLGVTVKTADYDKPETLSSALEGVERLLLISSSAIGSRVAQHKAVINAAESQSVKHLVYTSILRADSNPMMLAQEHKETEQLIVESSLNSVILRNGWYTENYTQGMQGIIENKAVVGVSINGKIHSAERNDYAEAAAKVLLTAEQHSGKVYELAGDKGFTLTDFAKEIAAQSGLDIAYHAMTAQAYQELLVNIGLPEGFAGALADSDSQTEHGWLQDESQTLSKLIGTPNNTSF